MGKLFDSLTNANHQSPINNYLREKGFYADTMNPRFMNGVDYDELTIGKHCLRHDSTVNNDCTLRIFINETDIYFEVQTSYRSYKNSGRYNPDDYPTVLEIDALLDEILEQVMD